MLIRKRGSQRWIASQFGFSEASVRRHRQRHLNPKLTAIAVQEDKTRHRSLLSEAVTLYESTRRLVQRAEESESIKNNVAAIRECRETLLLLDKLRIQHAQAVVYFQEIGEAVVNAMEKALDEFPDDDPRRDIALRVNEAMEEVPGVLDDPWEKS